MNVPNLSSPSTEIVLRPLSLSSHPDRNSFDMLGSHQAVLLGYLFSKLSQTLYSNDAVENQNKPNFSDYYPRSEVLAHWTGLKPENWPNFLSEFIFQYPNVSFTFYPNQSRERRGISRSEVLRPLEINLFFESPQILEAFRCSNLRSTDKLTTQFLISRCLFTCLYRLFPFDFSHIALSPRK